MAIRFEGGNGIAQTDSGVLKGDTSEQRSYVDHCLLALEEVVHFFPGLFLSASICQSYGKCSVYSESYHGCTHRYRAGCHVGVVLDADRR